MQLKVIKIPESLINYNMSKMIQDINIISKIKQKSPFYGYDIEIEFLINDNYIKQFLNDWYNLATGSVLIKVQYIGEIHLIQYNEESNISKRIELYDVFPIIISDNIITFRCDWFNELLP